MTSCAEGDQRGNEKCLQEPRPIARFLCRRGAKHDQNLMGAVLYLYPFDSASAFSRGF